MKLIEESSCDSIIDCALSTVKIVELLILLLEFDGWSCQYFFIPTQYNLFEAVKTFSFNFHARARQNDDQHP